MRKTLSTIYSVCCGCAAAILLLSCTAEMPNMPWQPAPEEEADSITTDSLGRFELIFTGQDTRATTTHITQEEAQNFLVTIYKGSDLVRSATRLKDLNTSLAAGNGYTIMAENCTTEEAITVYDGWGQRRYAGLSAYFSIRPGKTTAVNVGCSVANSGVSVVFDETVAQYFTTSYSVTIIDGDRTLVFDSQTAGTKVGEVVTEGKIAYFNLNENGEHSVRYIINAVGPKTITKEGTLNLSKAKISNITLDYDISYFDFDIEIDEEEIIVTEVVNITDDDIHVEDGTTEFNATHEAFTAEQGSHPLNAPATRAILGSNGNIVNWEDGDEIAVYDYKSTCRKFAAKEINGSRAYFSGTVTPKSQAFTAIYPYELATTAATSEASLGAMLPSTQYAVSGNIESALSISVAKGARNLDGSPSQVTFRNVTQLLRFDVPTYAENKISNILLTASTAVAGQININYSGDSPTTSIANTESKTITILPPRRVSTFEAGTYYIAAAPVQLSSFTLTYTCNGKTYTQSGTEAVGGTAGHIYNLATIDLINTPSVSAQHVYSAGVLQGTRLTLSSAPIEGRQWSAVIKNAAGTTVRSMSGTGELSSAETDATWPYLPKGNYTVSYTFADSNGKSRTQDLSFTITESPSFGVSVTAATTFSYYKGDDVTKDAVTANSLDPYTIYGPKVTITGISSQILSNSNYSYSVTNTFNGSQKSASMGVYTYNDYKVSNYQSYTLSATATFDGTAKSGSKTVHITGLPYTASPPSKSDWSGDANNWNGDGFVRLHNHTITKTFFAPEDMQVFVHHDVGVRRGTVSTTYTLSCSGTTLKTITPAYMKTEEDAGTYLATMKSSNPTVSCDNSYGNPGSAGTHAKIRSISVTYK